MNNPALSDGKTIEERLAAFVSRVVNKSPDLADKVIKAIEERRK